MDLEKRVQRLEDRISIREFYDRYCDIIHQREWTSYAGCFTDDAVFILYAPSREIYGEGPADIAATVRADIEKHDFFLMTIAGCHSVVEGDRASARISFSEFANGPEGGIASCGVWHDTLVRTAEGWKIRQRHDVLHYLDKAIPRGNTLVKMGDCLPIGR